MSTGLGIHSCLSTLLAQSLAQHPNSSLLEKLSVPFSHRTRATTSNGIAGVGELWVEVQRQAQWERLGSSGSSICFGGTSGQRWR